MDVNSSAVLPPAAGIICRAQLAHGLVNDEGKWLLPSSRGVQRRISRRVKPLASWIVYYALFFSLCVSVGAGLLKADVDFSNYDTPLFQQIVNRQLTATLGKSTFALIRLPQFKQYFTWPTLGNRKSTALRVDANYVALFS